MRLARQRRLPAASSMARMARTQRPQAQTESRLGALGADWLGACRRMVASQQELFDANRGIATRTVYEGVGQGGDRTLAIDRRCEDIVFAELDRLHASG